eukprot:CAMPEP_0181383364 /NCGR_PEP_ID=MMETSP1106-20121128/21310_1 /TAXON_ID=81844 /ORGANISM="Mantoniella antarctica, Strain SL-175" /LENGTH=53 /DNA_ID=CAMNT_0023502999 /DNA_START=30 /DNA_END=191 /DNA_ORIENTATION=-
MTVNPTPSRQTLLLHRPEKGKAGAEAAQQGQADGEGAGEGGGGGKGGTDGVGG